MEIGEILKRPYRRVIIPDEHTGTFTALIAEFPGCISEGDSVRKAYDNLQAAAESWLEAAIESGVPIPAPEAESEYSGRVVLRMPRSIHRRAVEAAAREGVSLNALLVAAISEKLGQASVTREVVALRTEFLSLINRPLYFTGMAIPAEASSVREYAASIAEGAGTERTYFAHSRRALEDEHPARDP
jgi:predicted RNase H-like HicB family nuclease